MRVRVVSSLAEFEALAGIWGQLTRDAGYSSPFLSHDWFACCWRASFTGARNELWLLEDTAGPVALVPLAYARTSIRGLWARTVRLLDSPDTPFVDLLVARGYEEAVEAFFDALRARRDWDVLSFRKIPAASPTLKTLVTRPPGRMPLQVTGRIESPFLAISGTWEEFWRGRTQRFKKTCRNIENRVQRAGQVTVEEHRQVDPDGTVLAEVLEVSRRSWKGPRDLAMATTAGMPGFFRELTRRASANGWLHIWILRLDGRAVATEYQIGDNGARHALRADFDSGLAELSPGSLLSYCLVRQLFERGDVREYDMGPGNNEYKLRWASGVHETVSVDIFAPTLTGRLLGALETQLVPVARRCRAWLGRDRT